MKRVFNEGDEVRIISLPKYFNKAHNEYCIGQVGIIDKDSPKLRIGEIYLIDNNKYRINFLKENLELVTPKLQLIIAEMESKVQDYENKLNQRQ